MSTSGTLTASSSGGMSLGGANDVAGFEATNGAGAALVLVNGSGSLRVDGADSAGDISLTQTEPRATLQNSGSISGENVTLSADSMSLSGGTIKAIATAALSPTSAGRPIDVGATAGGSLSLSGSDLDTITAAQLAVGGTSAGAITVGGTIAPANAPSLSLAGSDGFVGAGSGSLGDSSVTLINDGSTATTWTVAAGSVQYGSASAVRYSASVGTLALTGSSGGDTFNVSASPATTYSLGGNGNGTLNYDAQNRGVSGSLSSPSGEIDSPNAQPVKFSKMSAMKIVNRGGGCGPCSGQFATYTQDVLADAPSAYYPFTEPSGSTAVDDSDNNNDATYTGSISYGQPGVFADNSVTAIGTDANSGYVSNSSDLTALEGSNDRTVELWLTPRIRSRRRCSPPGRKTT